MSKYIDADRLKNGIMQYADKYGGISCSVTAFNILLERFAADVQEVKHGRWENIIRNKYDDDEATCSLCGRTFMSGYSDPSKWDYCPNCGSRMDLDGDTE